MSLETSWESDIANLLQDLAGLQDELLDVLDQKRTCMAAQDFPAMEQLQTRESELCDRLQSVHDRRANMLRAAEEEGLPAQSIRDLATAVGSDSSSGSGLTDRVSEASRRMRLLQHQSLTNWVLAQRTLLHLSQMLEILATGGRLKPTYGREESVHSRGALVDREA